MRNVESLTIWVDAVCIDQQAEIEKMHRVPLMQAISFPTLLVYLYGLDQKSPASDRTMCFSSSGILKKQYQDVQKPPSFRDYLRILVPSRILSIRMSQPENLHGEQSFL